MMGEKDIINLPLLLPYNQTWWRVLMCMSVISHISAHTNMGWGWKWGWRPRRRASKLFASSWRLFASFVTIQVPLICVPLLRPRRRWRQRRRRRRLNADLLAADRAHICIQFNWIQFQTQAQEHRILCLATIEFNKLIHSFVPFIHLSDDVNMRHQFE